MKESGLNIARKWAFGLTDLLQILPGRGIDQPESPLYSLRTSPFVRNVTVLASGAALAQGIMVLSAPVLTRLYTPADFGVLAMFIAIVSTVSSTICGKFEVALVVAKSDAHAKQLLGLALLVALALSLASLVLILLFWNPLVDLLKASNLGIWLAIVPMALFLNGVIMTFNYNANRLSEYGVISKSALVQAIVRVMAAITLGVMGAGMDGLLIGTMLGLASASIWLGIHYRQNINRNVLAWGRRKQLIARKYRDFPIYNALTGLFSGLYLALPVFFLASYFSLAVVGFYTLIVRVAQAPLGFISNAVSQVYLKKVSDLVNQNAPVRPCLRRLSLILAAMVTPVATILIIIAPDLFAWVFGDGWRDAGVYAQILLPALALRFVVSTVSSTLGGTGNNRLGAVWKVTAFIVTAGMFVLFAPRLDIREMFLAMLITDIALYLFYYLLIWQAAGHPRSYR